MVILFDTENPKRRSIGKNTVSAGKKYLLLRITIDITSNSSEY